MGETIIKIEGLRKTYDKKQFVLDGIDLELSEGDMAVIEGKSGSGKSTLMNIMGLLDEYDEGKLYIDDELIGRHNLRKHKSIRADKIGFVFQAYHLIESIPVKDNIMLPFLYNGKPVNETVIARYEEIIHDLGLEGLTEKKAAFLSGGEKQRVAIARAIIKNPKIIIADEPTGNLDIENTETVINTFRKLRLQGKVIVIVTHDISIGTKEDKKYYLKEGRLGLCRA